MQTVSELRVEMDHRDHTITELRDRLAAQQHRFKLKALELCQLGKTMMNDDHP